MSKKKLTGYEFYKSLGSPKYVVAPMVDHSELAFRMLCRKYNSELCYTPMLHAKLFLTKESYRNSFFTTTKLDRPLIAQFCANDPDTLLEAAQLLCSMAEIDGVDINFGCPQRIAKKGYYGSFLMEDQTLVHNLIKKLHEELEVPVTCKIRIFPEEDDTIAYVKNIVSAGCQLLTVHGRTREQKGKNQGLANWDIIKKIKETVSIPVFANGNIQEFDDVEKCMKYTGVDGVMSADALLFDPAFFSNKKISLITLAQEYLDFCKIHFTPNQMIRPHLFKLLDDYMGIHIDLREKLANHTKNLDEFQEIITELKYRVDNNIPPPTKDKILKKEQDLDVEESMNLFDQLQNEK
eukprot:gene10205-2624_t